MVSEQHSIFYSNVTIKKANTACKVLCDEKKNYDPVLLNAK